MWRIAADQYFYVNTNDYDVEIPLSRKAKRVLQPGSVEHALRLATFDAELIDTE